MSEKVYDLIIIGGGISGVGAALEASKSNLSTLILEKGVLLNAASANSLRIIHGGFRYLQTLSFNRIVSSIKAQSELLDKYNHYIKPLPCLLPLNRNGMKSAAPVLAANLLYSSLYKFYTGKSCSNKILSAKKAEMLVPAFSGKCPNGALLWHDAVIADLNGFHEMLKSELVSSGVDILEGTCVDSIATGQGSIAIQSGPKRFRARAVANCAGAWVDKIEINLPGYKKKHIQWCKAYNIVLNKQIEDKYALGAESRNGAKASRFYFMVPRGEVTVLGTEYTEFDGNFDNLNVSEWEIEEFISGLKDVLPELSITLKDVEKVEAGILPYINHDFKGYKLLGSEIISRYGNYFEVLSTKYTTFLPQARRLIFDILRCNSMT